MQHERRSRESAKSNSAEASSTQGGVMCNSTLSLKFVAALGSILVTICALHLQGQRQALALSLISEKCDPNKVGPDETTVKGGWQAEMFNGLAFRTCGK